MAVEVDTMLSKDLEQTLLDRLSELAVLAVETVLKMEKRSLSDSEVSVLFTDDDFIAELNSQYRGVEGPTDVLSFAMMDQESEVDATKIPGIPDMLGDIIISLDTAERQAGEAKKTLEEEISLLLVHGALHLLGYDHDIPEREEVMWDRQDKAVKQVLAQKRRTY